MRGLMAAAIAAALTTAGAAVGAIVADVAGPSAQAPATPPQNPPDAAERALRELVAAAPRLPQQPAALVVTPPRPGWELGMVSWVAAGRDGTVYLLQRGDKADPIVAVNRDGTVLRSWGRGLYLMPHAIRVDAGGNIWTTDAATSHVRKFTPDGRELLDIAVGDSPRRAATTSAARPTWRLRRTAMCSSPTATPTRAFSVHGRRHEGARVGDAGHRARPVQPAALDPDRRGWHRLRRRPRERTGASASINPAELLGSGRVSERRSA